MQTCSKALHCLSVGGEGKALLAAGGADNSLRVWDPRIQGNHIVFNCLEFTSPAGFKRTLVLASIICLRSSNWIWTYVDCSSKPLSLPVLTCFCSNCSTYDAVYITQGLDICLQVVSAFPCLELWYPSTQWCSRRSICLIIWHRVFCFSRCYIQWNAYNVGLFIHSLGSVWSLAILVMVY